MALIPQPYKFWSFDLKKARTDERLGLAGTDLIVFYNSFPIEIRLDDIRNDKIPITACNPSTPIFITGIPFSDIWMTNPQYNGGSTQFIVLFSGTSGQILEELKKPKGIDRILTKLGII